MFLKSTLALLAIEFNIYVVITYIFECFSLQFLLSIFYLTPPFLHFFPVFFKFFCAQGRKMDILLCLFVHFLLPCPSSAGLEFLHSLSTLF